MEQLQLPLLWFMLAAYIGSFMIYAFSFWSGNKKMQKLATKIVYIGLLLNALSLLVRSRVDRRFAVEQRF